MDPAVARKSSAVIVFGVALYLLAVYPFFGWTTDDAFISFRFSENLARGHGLVFNPGERVEGFSNPLWTLTLGLGRSLALSPSVFSKLLSLVFFAGVIAVSDRILRFQDEGWWFRICLAAAIACDVSLGLYSMSGMETVSYGLFIVLSVKLQLDRLYRKRDNVGRILLVCFLLFASRPEGALYSVLFLSQYSWQAVNNKTLPRSHLMKFAAFLAAVAAAFLARYGYYGDFLPNTFYAKPSGTFGRQFPTGGIAYLDQAVKDLGYVWPALLLLNFLELKSRDLVKYRSTLGWAALVLVAFSFYAGGDWMPNSRFLVPIFPLIYILGVSALRDLERWCRNRRYRPAILSGVAAALLFCFLHQYRLRAEILGSRDELPYDLMDADHHARSQALWLGRHFEPDCVVATKRIGVVPYYSELRTLDLYGLVDRRIAEIIHRHGSFMDAEAAGEIAEYVLAQEPTLIILYSMDPEDFAPHGPQEASLLERMGSRYRVLGDDAFSKTYFSRVFLREGAVSEAELQELKSSFERELAHGASQDAPTSAVHAHTPKRVRCGSRP